jgi:hypothetical protein
LCPLKLNITDKLGAQEMGGKLDPSHHYSKQKALEAMTQQQLAGDFVEKGDLAVPKERSQAQVGYNTNQWAPINDDLMYEADSFPGLTIRDVPLRVRDQNFSLLAEFCAWWNTFHKNLNFKLPPTPSLTPGQSLDFSEKFPVGDSALFSS